MAACFCVFGFDPNYGTKLTFGPASVIAIRGSLFAAAEAREALFGLGPALFQSE